MCPCSYRVTNSQAQLEEFTFILTLTLILNLKWLQPRFPEELSLLFSSVQILRTSGGSPFKDVELHMISAQENNQLGHFFNLAFWMVLML